MAKYRLLTPEELKGLEKDFVDYLVVNGIVADDWVKMKNEDPAAAQKVIDLFSDVVFEKILRGIEFLEIYEKQRVRTFKCAADEIHMITMEAENALADFTNPSYISSAMANPPDDLLVYQTEKPYNKERELEIFDMIENGCLVSNGNLYNALETAV